MEESKDIYVLNQIHEGVQMGMDSISNLLETIEHSDLQEELTKEYNELSKTKMQITKELENYNKVPKEQPIKDKMIGWTSVKMNLMNDKSDSHIAEMLIKGTQMGILNGNKLLNHNEEVHPNTNEIVNKFIQAQEKNQKALEKFL